jgi:hypothetical protein
MASPYSRDYLNEYWPESPQSEAGWKDNIVLMKAYQEIGNTVLSHFRHLVKCLDVSTGSALGPLLGMLPAIKEVQLSDYQKENREWIKNAPVKYWRNYVPMLTDVFTDPNGRSAEILSRLDQLRSVHEPVHVDLFKTPPFSDPLPFDQYELFTMNFVADSITERPEDYFQCLKRVLDLIKPKAALGMSAIVDSTYWMIGETRYPSPKVSESEILNFLKDEHFNVISLSRSERDPELTYDGGWIALAAIKQES